MTELAISQHRPSVWWGAMVICGTVVGAGMFTLPVVMAGAWFGWSVLILIGSWASMLMSGLLFLHAARHYQAGAGYSTLTRDLLGRGWEIINSVSILFVLGILTYAYISASGPVYQHSITAAGLPVTLVEAKILLTCCVAAVVCLGTKEVSRLMTVCLIAKIVLLVALFGGLLMQIKLPVLLDSQESAGMYWPYIAGVVPFCLASFGYHGNISGLDRYYGGEQQRVRKALKIGTFLALVIYLFWLTATMGNIPRTEFPAIITQGGDIEALLEALHSHLQTGYLTLLMTVFSHFAVLCSFLGVTSGLFDFIADWSGERDALRKRLKIGALTFLPPLLASIWMPNGFVTAIGYAGLLATIWAVIVPALLAVKARQRFAADRPMPLPQKLMVIAVIAFGVINIAAWTLGKANLLPLYR